MSFKQSVGNLTVEACVLESPGGMFKGYVRTTRQVGNKTYGNSTGRGCGRPVSDRTLALALAEQEAKRILASRAAKS